MSNKAEPAPPLPDVAGETQSGDGSSPEADRVFVLECRLEQMRASVDEARAEAHRARSLLAEATARESDRGRRHQLVLEDLAAARAEIESLHHRLEHSEAVRAGLEGRLFESTVPDDAQELVRLRSEAAAARDLTAARQRTVADLRGRVEELVASRETLLTRVSEWQCAAREGDADAINLSEFIAALRHDILELEHRAVMAEQREAELREQLRQAGTQKDADSSSTDASAAEPDPEPSNSTSAVDEPEAAGDEAPRFEAGDDMESRIDALLRLGRSGKAEEFYAIRPWLVAPEPRVRAAAYQALGQLLEHEPSRLEPHIRWGIADADARVRRRVVLSAASARGLDLRPLLDPLRKDPDSQVRRVVQEVLRRAPSAADSAGKSSVTDSDENKSEEVKYGVAS
ncbi:MAG: hypothetical protein U5R46_01510 [Gammaproteobacteria bacterium]|nr:hypothetical protein [Gammaproteobacteria bacterium]